MPDGEDEEEEITLEDIAEGDVVEITLDEDGNAAENTVMSMEMPGQAGGQAAGVDSYTAVTESDYEVEKPEELV